MPRTATARPPSEHLAALVRVQRQVGEDRKMKPGRRKKIRELLGRVMAEFQAEVLER